ncbi:MAG: DUF3379 domain-containing protein [Thioploca sp.]|nr:DUF3379 domain-containing protein [Thioploca sp.]
MNCQQFQQRCTLEPACQEPAFLAHQQTCPNCAHFAQELAQFEASLHTALQITVPADLTKRILAQPANQPTITPSGRRFHWQLAASLLLAMSLSLSGLWWWSSSHTQPLEQQLMLYLAQEPKAFLTTQQVSLTELHQMFNAIGAKLVGEIGTVSFCKVLKLNGYTSAHLVLVENNQPINILLIRNSSIRQAEKLSYKNLQGILLPIQQGNIALVATSTESLQEIALRLQRVIKWI